MAPMPTFMSPMSPTSPTETIVEDRLALDTLREDDCTNPQSFKPEVAVPSNAKAIPDGGNALPEVSESSHDNLTRGLVCLWTTYINRYDRKVKVYVAPYLKLVSRLIAY